jgi:hypothetical protein
MKTTSTMKTKDICHLQSTDAILLLLRRGINLLKALVDFSVLSLGIFYESLWNKKGTHRLTQVNMGND